MLNPFSSQVNLHESWKTINSIQEFEAAIEKSFDKPVILFKHSTTCSRSAYAKHRLESDYSINPEKADFFYLDLLNHRDISNSIASKLDVRHQSPQIIVVKKGKAVFDASHESITLKGIEERL